MKIIGESKDGWICELSTDEIAQIQGCNNTYQDRYKKPQVGMSLDVHKNWSQYYKVNTLINHKETLIQHCQRMIESAKSLEINDLYFKDGE